MSRRYGCRSSLPALLVSGLAFLVWSEPALAAPPNDKCPGAEVIPPAGPFPHLTTLIPDLGTATTSSDPFPTCVTTFSRGVWYSFTPAVTSDYRISTCNPPTGTTIYDSVLSVYTSANGTCTGTMNELVNGCNDDSCSHRSAVTVTLNAGTTYYIVASKWGAGAPAAGETAMQVEVTRAPANDTCENAAELPLNRTVTGSLTLATNDYEVSTSAPNCYALPSPPPPLGQPLTGPAASGRDAAYSFMAPADGAYTFRAQATIGGGDILVHVAATCASGAGPHTLTDCLGASNRNSNSADYLAADEVDCVTLTAGQTAYVYVDEAYPTTDGARFTIEATPCQWELEPNDDPPNAAPLACGLGGTISPGYDEDYFSLGSPLAGSRVFAIADGVAANQGDFDMRITTEKDTLEYDDSNNSGPWGGGSPNIAGTPLTGDAAFLKMSYFGGMTEAEPYHLYAVVQPPGAGLGGSSATPEVEPNNTLATATSAGNMFFSGTISAGGAAGDKDLFKFCAQEGDLIFLSIDGDPLRDETPLDPTVFLLDSEGKEVLDWTDASNFSVAFPGSDNLYATTPQSPGEAAVYRARTSGLHYAGVMTQFNAESFGTGDYLYSIGLNCLSGGELYTDLSIAIADTPDPVGSEEMMDLKIDVVNQGPRMATDPHWTMMAPAEATVLSVTAPMGWTCTTMGNLIDCSTTCYPAGSTSTFAVKLQVGTCVMPGTMTHVATITSKTADADFTNDTAVELTTIVDGGPCEDGNVCTTMDTCNAGTCVGGPANDCNDGNECTDDICQVGGGCTHTNNTNPCDDANACTTADKCASGQCKGGPALDCNDGDVCTDDLCDSVIGCMPTFNAAPCEDGNPCTEKDTCASGACTAGSPVVCAPLNDCQEPGVCDPMTGACSYFLKPDGTNCDDGNGCTMNDTCKAGACIVSEPIVCPAPPNDCSGPGTCDAASGSCKYPVLGGDLDNDGLGDKCDSDIDGDGIVNDEETKLGMNPTSKDSDGDDIDDCTEACPTNDGACFDGEICKFGTAPANTDGDDTIDALDSDSDNDGASDTAEAGDSDLSTPPNDANGDGLPDYRDPRTVNGGGGAGGAGGDVILAGGSGCACSTAVDDQQSPMPFWFAGLGVMAWFSRRRRQ